MRIGGIHNMSKFKVGDKVRYIGKNYNAIRNQVGTIDALPYDGLAFYTVIFPENEMWSLYKHELERVLDPIANNKPNSEMFNGCEYYKEEPLEVSSTGGKGSLINVAYQYIPMEVLEDLAKVFKEGSLKYEPDNWKKVPSDSHFNHLMNHMVSDRMVPNKEERSHALCRMVMYYYMRTYGESK